MPAAQHHRCRRLGHGCNHLGNRQSRLYVTAHSVEQDQQSVNLGVLLQGDQQGNEMLVFGCLLTVRQHIMPLDLPHDRKAMNGFVCPLGHHAAALLYVFVKLVLLVLQLALLILVLHVSLLIIIVIDSMP